MNDEEVTRASWKAIDGVHHIFNGDWLYYSTADDLRKVTMCGADFHWSKYEESSEPVDCITCLVSAARRASM